MNPLTGPPGNSKTAPRPSKSALIIVENQTYLRDTRVKAEAATLKESGWRVHVICPAIDEGTGGRRGGFYASRDIGGVLVHFYPMRFAGRGLTAYFREYVFSLFHVARLSWRIFLRHGFSTVHLCNPPDVLFVVGFFYKLLGKKIIFDHHDLFPEMVSVRFRGIRAKLLHRFALGLEFLTFKTADAVLSTNRSYREIALRRGRMDEERVFVVRNGPILGEIAPVPPDPELKKGFRYTACYAGVMGPEDGVMELMEGIRFIVHRLGRKDILFFLLGDGSAYGSIDEKVRDWHLQEQVNMPGMVLDRSLFRRYLSTADIALAPERSNALNDKSTFIKIAEYMAMAKPIVAYDLKETRHTAGDAAVFVPSGELEGYCLALVRLLEDPDRRERMGNSGLDRVKRQFHWGHQKGYLLEAYDYVMCRRK